MTDQKESARQTLDHTIEQFDSKFRFVLLAARRAEQITRGARPKLDLPREKPSRLAMEEVQRGMVEWDYGPAPEDAKQAESGEEGAADLGTTAEEASGETEAH